MSKAGRKKKRDVDVVRAGDIVPPYEKEGGSRKTKAGGKKTSASGKKRKQASKGSKSSGAGKSAGGKAAKKPQLKQGTSEIPKLDLGEKILAEQRKITAVRRKGPGRRIEAPAKEGENEPVRRAGARLLPELSGREQIIAEIVARDIERLCEGEGV